MCLGIPLKIVEINGKEAFGELNGVKKKIRVDLIKDLKIGDYVMVHAGFALEIMKEEQAKDTLKILEEIEELV
jgi:hydrogenase expression/formation protein HypC